MSDTMIEIERGYLYALMLSPHLGLTNRSIERWLLEPDELTGVRKRLLSAAHEVIEAGGAPDVSGIGERVSADADSLEELGECAMPRLVTLGQGFAFLREHHLRESRKRELILAAEKEEAGESVDPFELAERLSSATETRDLDVYTPEALARVAWERVAKHGEGGQDLRIKLGVPLWDDEFGGLDPGGLTTIGARPSVGKSTLALFLARSSKARVMIASCEDPAETWAGRYMSAEANVSATALRSGSGLSAQDFERMSKAFAASQSARFGVLNLAGKDIRFIEKAIERYARKLNPQIIIVDYAQSIGDAKARDERERIDRVINGLKATGGRCDAHVILMSQLRRVEDDSSEPSVQDLKASGRFEEASENIIVMWRNASRSIMARIAKNKSGRTGGLFVVRQDESTAAFTGIHRAEFSDEFVEDDKRKKRR